MSDNRIRIAACQYAIRPIERWEQFCAQVTGMAAAAQDYGARLLVLPEYFTLQLLTLGDVRAPMPEQMRGLAKHVPAFVELMSGLAKKNAMCIVAGTIPVVEGERVFNDSFIFGSGGDHVAQGKLHMTRWEREELLISARRGLKVIETDFGKLAVAICYDVEFPEVARMAARAGATVLAVPSCTDDRNGFLRVRYCAHARAVENQMIVVHAGTVGMLAAVPNAALHYGQAAILTPSDLPFARDGILVEGTVNHEAVVVGEVDLGAIVRSRESGTVLTLKDSETTAEAVGVVEVVGLR